MNPARVRKSRNKNRNHISLENEDLCSQDQASRPRWSPPWMSHFVAQVKHGHCFWTLLQTSIFRHLLNWCSEATDRISPMLHVGEMNQIGVAILTCRSATSKYPIPWLVRSWQACALWYCIILVLQGSSAIWLTIVVDYILLHRSYHGSYWR